ncbi:MAG: glycosyltransferase family 2 protein [Alistipes sp.]
MNNSILDIVLPCYNPAEDFIEVLVVMVSELEKIYPHTRIHLIVANDGSVRNFTEKEQTALLAAIPGTEIVNLHPNQGKGAAVRAGIARSQAEYTIYTDIDMPYSIETMSEVIDRVMEGVDVVIAIRNRSYYSKLTPVRKLMSHGSKWLNWLFLNIKYTDTQGGLKGLSQRAKQIMLRTTISDFLFDTEFIVLAARQKGVSITEVESTLRQEVVLSRMSLKVLFRELGHFFKIALRRWS